MWRLYVWLIIPIVMVFCLGGCKMEEDHSSPTQTMSLLTFDYDAARDVALAHTYPSTYIRPLTAQGYVTALAVLPAVNYHPTANIHLANPIPRVDKKHLVVNYDSASGLDQLSSSQAAGLMAVLEDWLWAYEIKDVDLLVEGRPVRTLGPLTITQPLHRQFHTYVIQPVTGEVGYLVGALTPKSLADAVAILNRKEISELPALHGFEPLLPPQVRITAPVGRITDGTLTANLSSSTLPSPFDTRLTGIVLMLTQFPGIDAVQFTFAGVKRDAPFMRGNLNAPISSMQLLLPP
ncbi:MAG TPA: GerMN domain-containing protein, partial [Armatimonadota bacterium]|nr:GerMN domain-containing protein [Armatimonadota bacterium]